MDVADSLPKVPQKENNALTYWKFEKGSIWRHLTSVPGGVESQRC
jgi:hypothetical protein